MDECPGMGHKGSNGGFFIEVEYILNYDELHLPEPPYRRNAR